MTPTNTISRIRHLLSNKMDDRVESVDLILSLLLDVIAFEIRKDNKISDKTGEALIQMTSFQSIEYYYHSGYLELDTELKKLASILSNYNERLREYKLGVIGTKPENWGDYFKEKIEIFIDDWQS